MWEAAGQSLGLGALCAPGVGVPFTSVGTGKLEKTLGFISRTDVCVRVLVEVLVGQHSSWHAHVHGRVCNGVHAQPGQRQLELRLLTSARTCMVHARDSKLCTMTRQFLTRLCMVSSRFRDFSCFAETVATAGSIWAH
jgi:hypothetical protein